MKVVIETIGEGFALSDKAVERCLELGMTVRKAGRNPQAGEPESDFVSLGKRLYLGPFGRDKRKAFRCDPRVIQAVEELGKDAASSPCELKIVEIPFKTTEGWEIVEIKGLETIVDVNRMWR